MNYSDDFKKQLEHERDVFLGRASQQTTRGQWTKSIRPSTGPGITNKQKGYLEVLRRQLAEKATLYDWLDVLDWLDKNPIPKDVGGAGRQISAIKDSLMMATKAQVDRILNVTP